MTAARAAAAPEARLGQALVGDLRPTIGVRPHRRQRTFAAVPDGQLILVAGALLAAGLLASLLAGRVRVPSLLLFLVVGMAIGSDGAGWIDFDDYELARTIGVVALALILFEGGLTSGLLEIRPVLRPAISLAVRRHGGQRGRHRARRVVAVRPVARSRACCSGAVLSSTDGAAIFALLRGSTLERKLARTLEAESGLNDPMAVLLVLGFIEWLQRPDYGMRRHGRPARAPGRHRARRRRGGRRRRRRGSCAACASTRGGLYPVASLTAAALAFGGADTLHGSGFLAVYLAGLYLGTAGIPAQRTVTSFHQGLAWVAQVVLFLSLGLLVFPIRAGRHRAGGHDPGARPRLRRPPRRGVGVDADRRPLHVRPSA